MELNNQPKYSALYLDEASDNLGEMLDYAVNACGMELREFWSQFLASGIAEQFANGASQIIVGRSGIELVREVAYSLNMERDWPEPISSFDRSPEFWAGWILARYQWACGSDFPRINEYLPIEDVVMMYHPLHEAPEEKFYELAFSRRNEMAKITRLQAYRKLAGLTQNSLCKKSGVSLRAIQQYEQRVKDINKASVASVVALAHTLGCDVEDLLE